MSSATITLTVRNTTTREITKERIVCQDRYEACAVLENRLADGAVRGDLWIQRASIHCGKTWIIPPFTPAISR